MRAGSATRMFLKLASRVGTTISAKLRTKRDCRVSLATARGGRLLAPFVSEPAPTCSPLSPLLVGNLRLRDHQPRTLVNGLQEDEVLLRNGIGSHTIDAQQRDRVRTDGDQRVIAEVHDADFGSERRGRDAEITDVKQVLATGRVGIELIDYVVAKAVGELEDVAVGATVHYIVAGAADQDVVAGAAIERVDGTIANQRIGTAVAVEHVGAAVAGNHVV